MLEIKKFFGYGYSPPKIYKKPHKILNLSPLDNYIAEKGGSDENVDFLKQFKTALNMGKYQLALLIRRTMDESVKGTDFDRTKLKTDLFFFSKINELLEQPDLFAKIDPPIQTELCNRFSVEGVKKASKEDKKTVEKYCEVDIERLFMAIKLRFCVIDPPIKLPKSVLTGSQIGKGSGLHDILCDLYEQGRRLCVYNETTPSQSLLELKLR